LPFLKTVKGWKAAALEGAAAWFSLNIFQLWV